MRLALAGDTMLGRGDFGQPLEQPLPPPPAWQPLALAVQSIPAARIAAATAAPLPARGPPRFL